MIRLILGGVGSGKSLSIVKDILRRKEKAFINFDVKNIPHTERLKVSHIIDEEITHVKQSGEPVKKQRVNWEFWNKLVDKKEKFDIYLDEIHNILHSRRSMTKWNTLIGIWISQIRKILGESESNNITAISQRQKGVDIVYKDLLHEIIFCQKWKARNYYNTRVFENGKFRVKPIQATYIIKSYFGGENCEEKFEGFRMGGQKPDYRSSFLANPYFQYYDSYQLIRFGEGVYL